jgi:pimeloyl-ACP methyl ester carboxylesterase
MLTARRYRDRDYYQRVAGRIYGGAARSDPAALFGTGPAHARPPSTQGYVGQLYAMAGWSSLPWLHRLPHPTLVMTGDDDPLVPQLNSRLIAWRIPDARLHVIPGGGHLFMLERPAEVAAVVSSFLAADLPTPPRA